MSGAEENLIGRFFEKQLWQVSILAVLFTSFYFAYDLLRSQPGIGWD